MKKWASVTAVSFLATGFFGSSAFAAGDEDAKKFSEKDKHQEVIEIAGSPDILEMLKRIQGESKSKPSASVDAAMKKLEELSSQPAPGTGAANENQARQPPTANPAAQPPTKGTPPHKSSLADTPAIPNSTSVSSTSPPPPGGTARAVVAAGVAHTCAVLANGTVRCWGDNYSGQLGNGTTTNPSTPVVVTGITTATAVAAGRNHTCAVLANGTVQCWGNNGVGQLVSGATAVAAGEGHTCALLANGTVRCWGNNDSGQLGNGSFNGTLTIAFSTPVAGITTATAIAAGRNHTCAVLANGTVQCWGNNGVGQLGKDTPAIAIGEGDTLTLSFTPVTVTGITTATAVAAGEGHTCALLANGTVQCWGDNQGGQLGNGTITRFHRSSSILVTTVTGITTATAIATGRSHTCALLTNGTVRCWGWNYSGQLGNGTNTNASTQVTVSGITTATAIAAGYAHTCAVLANGTVQCWGYGNAGQVWSGAIGNSSTPVQVSGLPSEGFLWPVGTKL